jgi:hypothetical protein
MQRFLREDGVLQRPTFFPRLSAFTGRPVKKNLKDIYVSNPTSDSATRILPVILAGGSGTRLWPLSRKHYAKQYLALDGTTTMLQSTVTRIGTLPCAAPL